MVTGAAPPTAPCGRPLIWTPISTSMRMSRVLTKGLWRIDRRSAHLSTARSTAVPGLVVVTEQFRSLSRASPTRHGT